MTAEATALDLLDPATLAELTAAEYYRTPAWVVDRLLDSVGARLNRTKPWLDPCCGDGAIPLAVDEWYARTLPDEIGPVQWQGFDVRVGGIPQTLGLERHLPSLVRSGVDFLDYFADVVDRVAHSRPFAVCVMNPPFSLALDFVSAALMLCDDVIMLQRVGWGSSKDRAEFLHRFPPSLRQLPNRPDFSGLGGDSQEYGWFSWGVDGTPTYRVLKTTPADVRGAQKPQLTADEKRALRDALKKPSKEAKGVQ